MIRIETDLAAIESELAELTPSNPSTVKRQPKRLPLPPELPRRDIRHEPDARHCACGCELTRIGEDIAEKLDYTPGTFTVERHIRGKWVCRHCETLVQAPVPAHVIDKGLPTSGLLAQVLVAKYHDHLPLYRQEAIFARAGLALPRSTLTHYLSDAQVPLDNNWLENRIRPVALGRRNWLFAGSLRAGQRAAAIMSLIQSRNSMVTTPTSI